MFFPERDRLIYTPPDHPDQSARFDPLALDRALVRATGGRLADLLAQHQAGADGLGDVSPGAGAKNALMSAEAEEQLVKAARAAFGLPDFPDCTDGRALEMLWHYLEYMAGKGRPGEPPPTSPGSTDSQAASSPTTTSLASQRTPNGSGSPT